MATVVAATFVFAAVAFVALGPPSEASLRIVEVGVAPAIPIPDRILTVFATVEGGSQLSPASVWLFHASSYRNELASAQRMTSMGQGARSSEIGPFANGAEVWIVVVAMTPTQGPVFSEHVVLAVGAVVKDAANLSVADVHLLPNAPGPTTRVTVLASVLPMNFVTKVFLTWGWFTRTIAGAGNQFMGTQDGIVYAAPIIDTGPVRSFPAGTFFFYRVAAIDAVGLTADSGVRSFTIS